MYFLSNVYIHVHLLNLAFISLESFVVCFLYSYYVYFGTLILECFIFFGVMKEFFYTYSFYFLTNY